MVRRSDRSLPLQGLTASPRNLTLALVELCELFEEQRSRFFCRWPNAIGRCQNFARDGTELGSLQLVLALRRNVVQITVIENRVIFVRKTPPKKV
jgi:hypothetical protein